MEKKQIIGKPGGLMPVGSPLPGTKELVLTTHEKYSLWLIRYKSVVRGSTGRSHAWKTNTFNRPRRKKVK